MGDEVEVRYDENGKPYRLERQPDGSLVRVKLATSAEADLGGPR